MAEARLPGLSATLVHTSWEHRSAFHAFVRSATAGRRAACLLATGAALGWLGGWDTSLLALLSVGCTSELSSGVKDPTLELFVYFAWLAALGLLSSLLAEDHGSGSGTANLQMLAAVAMVQVTLFHQLLLPWYPYLPLTASSGAALLTLFAHPSWAARSLALRLALALGLALLLPLMHLVLSYAARTIWCQEWLLAEFGPELYVEVLAERAALAAADKPAAPSPPSGSGAEHAERAEAATVVAVVGLPRSGTTYLFSLLERLHGDGDTTATTATTAGGSSSAKGAAGVVALSCYHILFFERCLVIVWT